MSSKVSMSSSDDSCQPARLAPLRNKTTPYLCNPQQKAPAYRSFSSALVYNSLPRPRTTNKDGPSNLPQARRKLVNNALQDYLKSLNAMTRSIVLETESVEKENHCDWTQMDAAKREEIMNEHFVPSGIRLQYERERASSCCSFTSSRSLGQFASQQDVLVEENRPTHLSQSSSKVPSRSSKDIMYTNQWSSMGGDTSVSQPSLISSMVENVQPSNSDRLHKNQLSFRSSHRHAIKPRYSTLQKHILPSHQLGSDGESQMNSDEDYDSNPLGFQRNRLRSFSMRSKRAGLNAQKLANLRSSVKTTHQIRMSVDEEESKEPESCTQLCQPNLYHANSATSTNTDFDGEIDMPDATLLLERGPRKFSAEETDSSATYQPPSNTLGQYRKGSSRAASTTALDRCEVIHNANSFLEESTELSAAEASSSMFVAESQDSNYLSQSRESFDVDSLSMAPSDISKYDEESILDPSRMTPESPLSISTYHSHPKSKLNDMAVFRKSKGKRGGSHFRVATSEFADRHTQFKTNMLQMHHLDSSSVDSTRTSSPSSSMASSTTPSHPPSFSDDTNFLQTSPNFIFPANSKHISAAESTGSDLPHSPMLSSSPRTPLAVSYTYHSQVLRKGGISPRCEEHRESGYISSSSESFPVAGHR